MDDACESLLSEVRECRHHGLVEGRVVGPRGGVGGRVLGSSFGSLQLDLKVG